jgi:hypothetical protein
MGQNDLGVSQLETQDTTELIASSDINAVSIPIVVLTGASATYKRGQVMGKNSSTGKYEPFDTAGSATGIDKIAAILVEDVDATSADVNTTGYVTGIFNKSALITSEVYSAGVHNTHGLIIIKELAD